MQVHTIYQFFIKCYTAIYKYRYWDIILSNTEALLKRCETHSNLKSTSNWQEHIRRVLIPIFRKVQPFRDGTGFNFIMSNYLLKNSIVSRNPVSRTSTNEI